MILFLHNKFASAEHVHVHSVVLTVLSVKCSQIAKLLIKIYALEPQINPCFGLLEQQETPC